MNADRLGRGRPDERDDDDEREDSTGRDIGLRLEPNSTDYVRMTRWGDYPGYKASNPVVSPDGRTIAFQHRRMSAVLTVLDWGGRPP